MVESESGSTLFTEEEIDIHRGQETCPRSRGQHMADKDFCLMMLGFLLFPNTISAEFL